MNTVKILVDGVFGSGKSSFIHYLSELDWITISNEPDDENAMSGFDFGKVTFGDDDFLYLFGTPNTYLLDTIWSSIDEFGIGIVLMLDSSRPDRFQEFRNKFCGIVSYVTLPIVVAANFQDKPSAWHPDDLRIALKIDDDIPILPCCATSGEDITAVMIALCEEYLRLNFEMGI